MKAAHLARRAFAATLVLALAVASPATGSMADLERLPLREIQADGWIRNQMMRDVTSGNLSVLDQLHPLGAPVGNSKKKAGYGEFEGNFMDALVRNAFLTGNESWLTKAKQAADYIADHQDAAGYVGRREPADFKALAQEELELWGQACSLRALLAAYEYGGDERYLNVARRSVDRMIELFGDKSHRYFIGEKTMEGGARAHGLMYADVLEALYRLTGDGKYRDFAFRLYDDYSHAISLQNTDSQLAHLLDANRPYLFHAPHVAEHARVVFWLATLTTDAHYRDAARNALGKLRSALSPSGGLITDNNILESVAGRRGSADLKYEYCSLVESAISLESAFQKSGDRLIAEDVENIVFNAAQAARFPDGKANAYCSKDNQVDAVGVEARPTFRNQYGACHRVACCAYNVGRLMPHYVSNLWLKTVDGDGLVAAFYGPSRVTTTMHGVAVSVEEDTLYPFEQEVRLTVNPAAALSFDLVLRDPSWSKDTRVEATGAVIRREYGYIRLSKRWTRGDRIVIGFTPRVEVRSSNDNRLYVRRGALLYALRIADRKTPTQSWMEGAFANYNLDAENQGEVKKFTGYQLPFATLIKAQTDDHLLTYEIMPDASADYPYDTPYGAIATKFRFEGKLVSDELVPIGSTLLRRTTFAEAVPP